MSKLKRVFVVAGILLAILALLAGIKVLQIHEMIAAASGFKPPAETVTTARVAAADWESLLTAVGSLSAVQGVTLSAEVQGRVARIAFMPGARVRAGQVLLEQDAALEQAQLRGIEARLRLVRLSLGRTKYLVDHHAVAVSQRDELQSQVDQAAAEADAIRASIRKKVIRAPFTGRLGLRLVNLGEVITSGTPIVSLQSVDPIYLNFSLPQQQLASVRTGMTVRLATTTAGEVTGTITAINPQVESSTRNVVVQATVPNPKELLRPGMFADVKVMLATHRKVLAIPAPAVLYAPYGDSVFVVEGEPVGPREMPRGLSLRQKFVRLGERRGDFVAVVDGLAEGQTVVSTGAFKLRNGGSVIVDNKLSPGFKLSPTPSES
jgi:membrane fusion protein, multidrug efflux system